MSLNLSERSTVILHTELSNRRLTGSIKRCIDLVVGGEDGGGRGEGGGATGAGLFLIIEE